MEKIDFYTALRNVAGTKRMVKFDGTWYNLVRFKGVHCVGLGRIGSSMIDAWWPTDKQAKEKVWGVEEEKPVRKPEPKPKIDRWMLKTPDLADFKYGDIIVKANPGQYAKEGHGIAAPAIPYGIFEAMPQWFMKIEEKIEEPKETEAITVFCVCDDDGRSCIYAKAPKKLVTCWFPNSTGGWVKLPQKNLFPKTHYVRRKLILEEK